MVAKSVVDEHCRRNRSTVERWETMAPHRARVTQLVGDARGAAGESLCLLGAGNGNDVDLARLTGVFQRIVLVDIDHDALLRAAQRVDESAACRIELLGSTDLTEILPMLSNWRGQPIATDPELDGAIETAHLAPAPEVGTFDVVGSTCVLTQLIDSIYWGLPPDHPRCHELVMAVRNRHLEMIAELLNPGGAGVLVTDFVSTDTAPEIAQLDELQMPSAAVHWIKQRNFFTGANPVAIRHYYQNGGRAGPAVEDVRVTDPWRWDIGAKQFAVSAVTFRRGR